MNYHRLLQVTVSKHTPPRFIQAKAKASAEGKKCVLQNIWKWKTQGNTLQLITITYISNGTALETTGVSQTGI